MSVGARRRAAAAGTMVLAVGLAFALSSVRAPASATPTPGAYVARPAHPWPPMICVEVDVDIYLWVVEVHVDIYVVVGGPCHPPPPPKTTTTTTLPPTTTTTLPPPPPPPPPPPTTTTAPPATTTTTAPSPPATPATTVPAPTTTRPPPLPPPPPAPPPPPPPPPPAQLSVEASVAPSLPIAGEPATAIVRVRNEGSQTLYDVVMADELSSNTVLRSASSGAGSCTVAGRRAECRFDRLAPGESATAELRLVLEADPASHTVVQRISLGAGDQVDVASRAVSTLLAPPPPAQHPLLSLPGPTVTLVAFVGFVLASQISGGPIGGGGFGTD